MLMFDTGWQGVERAATKQTLVSQLGDEDGGSTYSSRVEGIRIASVETKQCPSDLVEHRSGTSRSV